METIIFGQVFNHDLVKGCQNLLEILKLGVKIVTNMYVTILTTINIYCK